MQPVALDPTFRPPSEMGTEKVTPKYNYSETFDRVPFTGTDEFLPTRPIKQSDGGRNPRSAGSLSRPGQARQLPEPKIRTRGGPDMRHIKKYGLGLGSHAMKWFTSIMPLTPDQNLEDLEDVDPVEDGKGTKFCVSNWQE